MNKGRKFVFAIVLTLAIFVLASCSIIIDDTHHHLYDENGLCACGDHEASHPELEKYTVSFVDENGKVFESVEVVAGTLVNKPADPSVPGQKFEGWFNGEQEWNFRKHAVVEDTTLTARFTDNAKYEIIYELNGGEFEEGTVLEEEYVSGVGVETLPTPSKEHYVFVGWFINNEQVNGIAPSKKSNVTLVAKWALIEHAISYELNGGSFREGAKIPTEYKETVGLEKLPTPSKTGYTFVSWMIDEKEVSSIAPESLGEVKLVAKWQINEYTITYIVDGKEEVVTYEYDEEVKAPEAPEKEGYSFVGWSEDIPTQMPAENIKLVAKWQINEYTLKINVDGQITEVVYEYNEVVKVPEAPEKEGYSFVKWNNLPSQMPAKDVEVTAEFKINTYTLIINLGNKTQSISYKYNEAVAKLEEPTRLGYIFKGWSSETPEKMPAKNVTITAKWEVKPIVSIKEANDIAKQYGHNTYSSDKFTIEGTITKIVNTSYGNMYVEADGVEIYVYGVYGNNGNTYFDKLEVQPGVGDYIKLTGILGTYNSSAQMKNAWIVDHKVHEHKYVQGSCELCGAAEPVEGAITTKVVIKDYASANGFTNGTKYTTIKLDEVVTATAKGGSNTGKYYTSGTNWRFYQNEKAQLIITCVDGYELVSITVKYASQNNGCFVEAKSDELYKVTGAEAILNVGNTSSATNGQARITEITVVYVKAVVKHEHTVCPECKLCTDPECPGEEAEKCAGHEVAPEEPKQVTIAEALGLADGAEIVVSGTVDSIDTAWSDQYENITVTIIDKTGKIQAFRMSTKVELGDIITVTGKMSTYNNARQIAQGSTAVIIGHDESYDEIETVTTIKDALTAKPGTPVVVSGTVMEINSEWDSGYKNMCVTITDGKNSLYVYRLKTQVVLGDIITVTGEIGNYNNANQVAQGATAIITGHDTSYDEDDEPTQEVTAQLSFADKANRKEFSTSKQVWTQNGVTLTNNKAKSTSNVADYANPARFYKNSEIIVTATGSMTKIVFTCNSSSYATALKNSIGTVSGATISVSGSKVTVTFASAVESFTVSLSSGQVRMNSLEVTLQSK